MAMTPADYKTAHEALGVNTAFLAEHTGVTQGRIWAYEHPGRKRPVPPTAARVMHEMLAAWEAAAERIAGEIQRKGQAVIVRHVSLDAFHKAVPELRGWPETAQGPLLAEVQRRLQLPIEYR